MLSSVDFITMMKDLPFHAELWQVLGNKRAKLTYKKLLLRVIYSQHTFWASTQLQSSRQASCISYSKQCEMIFPMDSQNL